MPMSYCDGIGFRSIYVHFPLAATIRELKMYVQGGGSASKYWFMYWWSSCVHTWCTRRKQSGPRRPIAAAGVRAVAVNVTRQKHARWSLVRTLSPEMRCDDRGGDSSTHSDTRDRLESNARARSSMGSGTAYLHRVVLHLRVRALRASLFDDGARLRERHAECLAHVSLLCGLSRLA